MPATYEVVVCTYNGAPYLQQQLDSIAQQSPPPERIIISDDGSTDSTLNLAHQWQSKASVAVTILRGPGQGIVANTFYALQQSRADYVFLADQDDVWLTNKAELFCRQMHRQNTPHLIFSDALVWHPDTNRRTSFWATDRLDPERARRVDRLAFHNTVQGASACINRSLIDRLVTDEPRIMIHDWWMALVASGLGDVSIISEPTLLYRQHTSNQLGSRHTQGSTRRPRALRRHLTLQILEQAWAFADHYAAHLNNSPQEFLIAYARACRGHFFQRLGYVIRYRPQHKSPAHTLRLWLAILQLGYLRKLKQQGRI
ncbi:glycosyltransferase family 2 protein [Gilvimarinus xylanilyticus]|uniref:Glycosyltransferase family 2 protein n=1 Tax=Gilvimarinus xylanilyticus TaxID=2944139 RepID=A0A9X2I183_9GAMM|nr:glycosyltransferase family 2 protein [Gilvimarinus xylanilyticus]MCP8900271.1 glycosyltransferase family 2 protein [Gilvimarinus xylanilyticus]